MFCVRDFSRQLLDALDFLHGFGLIHTDLKPEVSVSLFYIASFFKAIIVFCIELTQMLFSPLLEYPLMP